MRLTTCIQATLLAAQAHALSIHEATIEELQNALVLGQITAVELAAKHLHRVARYDRRGPCLNSIPVINQDIFLEAQASDQYRADTNGSLRSQLEGIPYTLKDSYMAANMTVASGSPAFVNLTASKDAFTVGRIRAAGGILFGKTNMPPMANGGMQRGVYGRAESPYNKDYLAAAFASGSSNGAGVSTGASLAVFGMGEETVSSGRSPASNNGLVAYTPSRGVLSIRGNWPLFPTADVVVPYARTVNDMLRILDVLVAEDKDTTCDFWRGQPFVSLPAVTDVRPQGSYLGLANSTALKGKRLGVPKMYINGHDPAAQPVWVNPTVMKLWKESRRTLESLGATVEEVDFPIVTEFESKPASVAWKTDYPLPGSAGSSAVSSPENLAPYSWDDYLGMVNDPAMPNLTAVDPLLISPQWPKTLPDRYGNSLNNRSEYNKWNVDIAKHRNGTSLYDLEGLNETLHAVEAARKMYLEDWMDQNGLDLIVFPSAGDVGPQDAETNETAALLAWRNGVYFSNGNYAIRQFGIPTVSVTMGAMSDTNMLMSLTFASKAYDDNMLLSCGSAFESLHMKRFAPPRTPELVSDVVQRGCGPLPKPGKTAPKLDVQVEHVPNHYVRVSGSVDAREAGGLDFLEVYADGVSGGPVTVKDDKWAIETRVAPFDDVLGDVPK
ncbi:hypothetical protein CEP51_008171 [Fusarium floridanum]|uniref:Amidase domain-containing protein n=1 Tax=Fusarium floridanum TaxID=1325733 RepID=A0A428RLQ8_9HYPO|nr:hypothetical protein CEP51_008171 [Fusarium floridanum]